MYFGDFFGFFGFLLLLGLVVLIFGTIIRWFRHGHEPHPETTPTHRLSAEEVKKLALGFTIAVVTPLFLFFLEKSLLPAGQFSEATATFQFTFGVIAGLFVFVLGLLARRVPVVGASLAWGGLIYLIAIVTIHFPAFDPLIKLLVVTLALILVIATAYLVGQSDQAANRSVPTLSGIKGFGMGLVSFILSSMVVSFAVQAFTPKNIDYLNQQARAAADSQSFMVVMGLSILFLVLGLLMKSVRTVSWGLMTTGVLAMVYALFVSFDALGGTGVVLVTGLGLAILIYLAYRQFAPTSAAPSAPPPTSSNTK